MILGDNTILVLTDQNKTAYINYDVLNYMMTNDEAFCSEAHDELQNLMRSSTLIIQTSEKQRNMFFRNFACQDQRSQKNI